MAEFNPSKQLSGTWGQVWVEDEELAEIKEFQAKIDVTKEDIRRAGDMATYTKATGYKGKGSLKLSKVYTRFYDMFEDIDEGINRTFSLIVKLSDPNSDGEERWKLTGCQFDDFTFGNFNVGKLTEEDHPFTFAKAKKMDSIDLV